MLEVIAPIQSTLVRINLSYDWFTFKATRELYEIWSSTFEQNKIQYCMRQSSGMGFFVPVFMCFFLPCVMFVLVQRVWMHVNATWSCGSKSMNCTSCMIDHQWVTRFTGSHCILIKLGKTKTASFGTHARDRQVISLSIWQLVVHWVHINLLHSKLQNGQARQATYFVKTNLL